MSPSTLTVRRLFSNAILPKRPARLEQFRVRLAGGASTMLHVASYDRAVYTPRVVRLEQPMPLVRWCQTHATDHAVVGAFYVRPDYEPLGELRLAGEPMASVPFDEPWAPARACLHVSNGDVRIAARKALDADPPGDLLQAGPVLVRDGALAVRDGLDSEGFSAGAHQFDSDITDGRYPRAALALTPDRLLAVACDGRTGRDAGMTLPELADALVDLGATDALNLDGGGSATLIYERRLRNRPREQHGVDLLDGRTIATAIVFETS
ncbi:MAG: phosphodiester glycosidase family protein [Solirubrobacteraceae bacterium]